MNIKLVEAESIDVTGKTLVKSPRKGQGEQTLDMTKVASKFNNKYSVNKETICFVHKHRVFVTPFTRNRLYLIEKAGLEPDIFHVPFSNGGYPVEERERWERLRVEAHGANHRTYESDCRRWADKNGIRPLKKRTMDVCFRIPFTGVPVEYPNFETRIYPLCKEHEADAVVLDKLGTFCQSNGNVVFIYRDGHTYVTRCHWITNELREAGYKERHLSVPFSNEENILDEKLARKWESGWYYTS